MRIASYNVERLGEGHKDYAALARVVSGFDVVAAEEVMNARGMAQVMAKLGPRWSDLMSAAGEGSRQYQEHFGFFYDNKIELVKDLGEYLNRHEFFRPPYGARFRVKATGFIFNLVACHIIYGKSERERVSEINHLGEVYRYFEARTGGRGETIIAGDFNEERVADFESLVDSGDKDVIPVKGTTIGMRGPDHGYDHMFVSAALQPRVVTAVVCYWTTDFEGSRKNVSDHFPVFMVLKTGR